MSNEFTELLKAMAASPLPVDLKVWCDPSDDYDRVCLGLAIQEDGPGGARRAGMVSLTVEGLESDRAGVMVKRALSNFTKSLNLTIAELAEEEVF